MIPKRNSVFEVEINGFVSHIYGNKFEQRASERSAKKFKVRGTIDLWGGALRTRTSASITIWTTVPDIRHDCGNSPKGKSYVMSLELCQDRASSTDDGIRHNRLQAWNLIHLCLCCSERSNKCSILRIMLCWCFPGLVGKDLSHSQTFSGTLWSEGPGDILVELMVSLIRWRNTSCSLSWSSWVQNTHKPVKVSYAQSFFIISIWLIFHF